MTGDEPGVVALAHLRRSSIYALLLRPLLVAAIGLVILFAPWPQSGSSVPRVWTSSWVRVAGVLMVGWLVTFAGVVALRCARSDLYVWCEEGVLFVWSGMYRPRRFTVARIQVVHRDNRGPVLSIGQAGVKTAEVRASWCVEPLDHVEREIEIIARG